MKRVLEYLMPVVVILVVYAIASCIMTYVFAMSPLVCIVVTAIFGMATHTKLEEYKSRKALINLPFYILCYLVPLAISIVGLVCYGTQGSFFELGLSIVFLCATISSGMASVLGAIKLITEGLY